MHPIIFKFGPVTIYSYGLMVAIAFIFGIYFAKLEAIRKNIKVDLIYDFIFYLIIASLIGARLYYVLFFNPAGFREDPAAIFKIWQGGLSIHGALLGGILVALLFSEFRKISFWRLADITAPSIILGQAIGRFGCFLNGCCFGTPTKLFFGVRFPKGSLPHLTYGDQLIHPAQLYESIFNIMGFILLWLLRKKIKFDGGLFLLYLIIYSIIRLIVSEFRGDNPYLWDTHIKIAQVVSMGMIIIAGILFFRRKSKCIKG